MKRTFLVLLALGLVGAALLVAVGVAVVDPLDGHGLHVVIDDRELDLQALGPGEVLAGTFGLLVAAAVLALVVPLALLLGLALPLLLVLGAVMLAGAALLGVGTLALAPLWLPLLLGAWLWRRARRPPAAPPTGGDGGATIGR
jgi:hypothetical protein